LRGGSQGSLGCAQFLLDTGDLPGHQRGRCRPGPQPRSGVQRGLGQRIQPGDDCSHRGEQVHGYRSALDQPLGALDVMRGSRMAKSLKHQVIVFKPLAGTRVKFGHAPPFVPA